VSQYIIIVVIVVLAIIAIIVWSVSTSQSKRTENKKEETLIVEENDKPKAGIIDGALGILWEDNSNIVSEKMKSKLYTQIDYQTPQPATAEITYSGRFADEPVEVLVRFFNDTVYEIEIMIKPSDLVGIIAVPVLQQILAQLKKKYGLFNETTDLWVKMYQTKTPNDFLIRTWRGKTSNGNKSSIIYLPIVHDTVIFTSTALLLIYSDDTKGKAANEYRINTKYNGI